MNAISTKETATLARKELKAAFPGIKFSVRSYEFGSYPSLSISWIDGPTPEQVQQALDPYVGVKNTMDPYTDFVDTEFIDNGTGSYFSVSGIKCHREVSADKVAAFVDEVLGYMGMSKEAALGIWNDDDETTLNTCSHFGVLNVDYSTVCFGSFTSNVLKTRAFAA